MSTLAHVFEKFKPADERLPIKIDGTREDLALLFCELGFLRGVEVGVEQGKYSEVLCRNNPGLRLDCVDSWKAYDGYREHVSQDKIDNFLAITRQRLKPYDCKIVIAESLKAAQRYQDGELDFVYIDANHEFVHVVQDIAAWSKKVRLGGIVSGHDFVRDKNRKYINHVKDVVPAWAYSHAIRPWFVLTGDKSPSWFWVV